MPNLLSSGELQGPERAGHESIGTDTPEREPSSLASGPTRRHVLDHRLVHDAHADAVDDGVLLKVAVDGDELADRRRVRRDGGGLEDAATQQSLRLALA